MSISDRKDREKKELNDLILKEARALFLQEGFEKTSIRKIADRIEYSPATIYLYFKDKNELLLALHQESFTHLFESLSSVASVPDAFERLVALGRAYINYGLQHPEDYDLMFMMSAPLDALEGKKEIWCDGQKAIELVKMMVEDCKQHGYFKPDLDPEIAAIMLWAQVHGIVSLHLKHRFNMFEGKDLNKLIGDTFNMFTQTLQSFK